MNSSLLKAKVGRSTLTIIILTLSFSGCEENEVPKDTFVLPEIGKPIAFEYDPNVNNSFEDTYYDMDVAVYIPKGIKELKNRPLMFTLSTLRNSSVAGSLLPVIKKYGMIAISPLNGKSFQFSAFLESMIESEYVDPSRVYMAGFSNGGRDISNLAWAHQDKVKGVVLLEPRSVTVADPVEESILSVCIVCQDMRAGDYSNAVARLNRMGIRTKIIGVEGTDHFGIMSSEAERQRIDCFEFVRKED